MQTLEPDRGLDSRLLADALLDVEVALLNGEGQLLPVSQISPQI